MGEKDRKKWKLWEANTDQSEEVLKTRWAKGVEMMTPHLDKALTLITEEFDVIVKEIMSHPRYFPDNELFNMAFRLAYHSNVLDAEELETALRLRFDRNKKEWRKEAKALGKK